MGELQQRHRTKRWHHKSRAGCINCRQRRIKCDERRTGCENCERAAETCSYRRAASSSSSRRSPPSPLPCTNPPTALRQHDLEFMHQYCVFTANALGHSYESQRWFQEAVPRLVLQNDFSSSSLLAVAAAHLAKLKPEKHKYITMARIYLDKALVSSNKALEHLNSTNAGPLYLTSILVNVAISALSKLVNEDGDAISRFVACSKSWHGITVLVTAVDLAGCAIQHEFFAPARCSKSHTFPPESEFFGVVSDLRRLVSGRRASGIGQQDEQKYRVYMNTLDDLETCYSAARGREGNPMIIRRTDSANWDAYCTLLLQRDEMARLICLCWSTLSREFDDMWFVDHIFADVIRELSAELLASGKAESVRVASLVMKWCRDETDSSSTTGSTQPLTMAGCSEETNFAMQTTDLGEMDGHPRQEDQQRVQDRKSAAQSTTASHCFYGLALQNASSPRALPLATFPP